MQEAEDQEGIVAGLAGDGALTFPEAVEDPAVGAAQGIEDELRRVPRGFNVAGPPEHPAALGQRGDHQTVPVGQDLIVLERMNAGLAHSE